jgi:hypothetical protein
VGQTAVFGPMRVKNRVNRLRRHNDTACVVIRDLFMRCVCDPRANAQLSAEDVLLFVVVVSFLAHGTSKMNNYLFAFLAMDS